MRIPLTLTLTLILGGMLMATGCGTASETPATDVAEDAAAAAPAPRVVTAVPVTATTRDQAELLMSADPTRAANKKIAYDFFRVILRGQQLDQADQYMTDGYIQHNPNADTGKAGFLAYFAQFGGGPKPVPDTLDDLVAIQAEGDLVTLSFVRSYPDPAIPDATYTTTWFDMFRIADGKIVEHWDSATKF
jgi:predicted SnoaL-like aldol condensation-catalyzing enzyme